MSNADASISAAQANVGHAEAGVARAEAESRLASDILHRVEPLLEKQYVTVDEVDRARTADQTAAEALRQARAQLALARAQLNSALAQKNQSQAGLRQSGAQLDQSVHNVTTLDPLTAQRGALAAAVRDAQYRFDRCRVTAPFDARVTSLTISEGAYAHTGQQIFTLIDVRTWWVIGNYRESQLNHIRPGMPADLYVMSKPTAKIKGKVDSVGFGVVPEGIVTPLNNGSLPNIERTLNWVQLATRFPVRVKVESSVPDLLRIGESPPSPFAETVSSPCLNRRHGHHRAKPVSKANPLALVFRISARRTPVLSRARGENCQDYYFLHSDVYRAGDISHSGYCLRSDRGFPRFSRHPARYDSHHV